MNLGNTLRSLITFGNTRISQVKTPLALNEIPEQARQRRMTPDEVVQDVMMGNSRIKEMMSQAEVANLFIRGFSHYSRYLVGGRLTLRRGHGAHLLTDGSPARLAETISRVGGLPKSKTKEQEVRRETKMC